VKKSLDFSKLVLYIDHVKKKITVLKWTRTVMSKKKKQNQEISVAMAAEISGVDYQTMIQRVRSKLNPIPAHRKPGHGKTLFINLADLKKYRPNPVGWPKGRKKKDAKDEKATAGNARDRARV